MPATNCAIVDCPTEDYAINKPVQLQEAHKLCYRASEIRLLTLDTLAGLV